MDGNIELRLYETLVSLKQLRACFARVGEFDCVERIDRMIERSEARIAPRTDGTASPAHEHPGQASTLELGGGHDLHDR